MPCEESFLHFHIYINKLSELCSCSRGEFVQLFLNTTFFVFKIHLGCAGDTCCLRYLSVCVSISLYDSCLPLLSRQHSFSLVVSLLSPIGSIVVKHPVKRISLRTGSWAIAIIFGQVTSKLSCSVGKKGPRVGCF